MTGVVSTALWPLAWSRFGGADASLDMGLIVATLLIIALPAHAFVVGFSYRNPSGRALDVPLLKRVAAWLLAALATVGVMALVKA